MIYGQVQYQESSLSTTSTASSSDADASCVPLGENATDLTELLWPLSPWIQRPEAASQSRTANLNRERW